MASKKIAGITIELSTDTAKLTKGLDKVSRQFEAVGKAFTKNVTAPIMAIGAASIAAFKQVDEGMDIIIQKTGATGDELAEMQGIFKDIASSIPTDMNTIGEAVGEVNTRFGATGEVLEEVSGQFIKFAQLNGQDVTSAIDGTQKALAAYGLGVENASAFLDAMNKVSQQTGISVETLQSGVLTNATAFKEMGLSIEQATAFMGQLELSGVDTSTALTGLKRALKNATKEGKPLNEALAELEDSIVNGTDSMDGLTLAYDIFGRQGDQIYNALKTGTLSFNDLASAALDAGGSVSDTFEATLDPTDRFKVALQQLQLIGADIGAKILDVLNPAIEKFAEWLQKVSDKWNELSPGMQEAIIKIAMIAAAIGPVLMIIGKVISVVSTVIALGSKVGAIIGALSGPIGWVVLAIGGLVAIGVALYKNWDEIKAKAEEIWGNIKEFFSETLSNIKEKVSETWSNIKEKTSETLSNIKEKTSETWGNIKEKTSQAWSTIKGTIEQNGGGIKGAIITAVEGYKKIWSDAFSAIDELTGGKLSSLFSKVQDKLGAVKDFFYNIIEKIKGFFPIRLSNVFSNFKIPHISAQWVEGFMGIKYPKFSVDWYAKAYQNAMRFSSPTVLATPSGYKGFGDGAGAEWVVGENNLLSTIQRAMSNTVNPELIYEAVRQGASEATLNLYADGKKLTNVVNEQNTNMLASTRRMQGAF